MTDWLPSLNALRAFEAVCRHRSYASAAAELHVTPAAVKQLVYKLERALGAQLVRRNGRGVVPTEQGLLGLSDLSSGFERIAVGVGRLRRSSVGQRLIASVEPSVASTWLVPRLERFRRDNSGVDVLIASTPKLADLKGGEADVAIRFATGPHEGLVAHRLFEERLCAFCSPGLAKGDRPLSQPLDLEQATLLHWDTSDLNWASATRQWMSWQSWLDRVGAGHVNWRRGIVFNDYNLAVQGAVASQGVVLGSLPILRDLVSAGLLIDPLDTCVDPGIGYDVVATAEALERPEVRRFVEWIVAEAQTAAR